MYLNGKKSKPAPNRIVYAHRLFGGSGYEKLQSGYALCAILSLPKIFVPEKCFAFSLSGTKILRIQPERYAQYQKK
jgi:hypothetical protein